MKTNKKQISMLKLLISMTLVIILCIGAIMPVFAADPAKGEDSEHPAVAVMTKLLKMPIGTITPDATFTFEFEPVSVDGTLYNNTNMPEIENKIVTFNPGKETSKNPKTDNGVKEFWIETDNIVENDGVAIVWPHAGKYIYYVTEKEDVGIYDGITEWMIYSKAKYKIEVLVYEDPTTNELYVAYIIANRIKDDEGNPLLDPEKVDPTPGDDSTHDYSQVLFTNEYAKTNGRDPEDPDPKDDPRNAAFEISKKVSGPFAEKSDRFDFTVTIKKPAAAFPLADSNYKYKAYVVKTDDIYTNLTSTDHYSGIKGTSPDQYIEFTSDVPLTVKLQHDEKLIFVDMPVGASFKVNEKVDMYATRYKASYFIILDGSAEVKEVSPTFGADFAVYPSRTLYIGENTNSVRYENLTDTTAPMGISVSDLPYVMIIALTLISLAGVVVLITRKYNKRPVDSADDN